MSFYQTTVILKKHKVTSFANISEDAILLTLKNLSRNKKNHKLSIRLQFWSLFQSKRKLLISCEKWWQHEVCNIISLAKSLSIMVGYL